MSSLAEDVVEAIHALTGEHPGHRTAHAKGTLMTGTFTPNGSGLTKAAHMQDEPSRVTVRFSNGGGDPNIPDYAQEGRGMAVKFYGPDGSKTDVVALTLPCFFVRTPEDFLSFTQARKDPEKLMPDWFAAHPEALPAIQAHLGSQPPASYATAAYNSIHSFRWIDADGGSRFVRYRFEPEEGEQSLTPEEAKERGRDYLQEDILARGESAFRLLVVIADESDPVDDPTVPFPDERERVEVGRLVVDGPELEREQGDDILVFDPVRVIEGIELSGDPILQFRSDAYRVSVGRRVSSERAG
ncbi:MAG TPA: catalase family peroxidase [Thermoleophilaceae bacterium]|nr:catalase family peroxidase [Thermoleophilaceae bacterium]